jgi:hypothetical protein
LRFEEKNGEFAACLKYSVHIFDEKKYKMQHLEGSGTPVLYIGRTDPKGELETPQSFSQERTIRKKVEASVSEYPLKQRMKNYQRLFTYVIEM